MEGTNNYILTKTDCLTNRQTDRKKEKRQTTLFWYNFCLPSCIPFLFPSEQACAICGTKGKEGQVINAENINR